MNDSALAWDGNWAWSLPLIAVTVVLHVAALGLINRGVLGAISHVRRRRSFNMLFMIVMGVTTLLATLLHALEAALWAAIYRLLGAMPNGKGALLYSLNAMTTYGHSGLALTAPWQLMGALEALNGMLLFGLTTAFLYGVIQRVWPAHEHNAPTLEKRATAARPTRL
jgi:MFS superfamily sulfate permease-like transporter